MLLHRETIFEVIMTFLPHLLFLVILSSSAILTSGTLVVLADQLPSENQCLTKAYVIDPSEVGLNVRRRPSSTSKILGRLPQNTTVNVLGMKNSWLLVSVVSPREQKVDFKGEGWVFSSLLGVSSQGYGKKAASLYSRPSVRSSITGKISSNSGATVLGCNGKWLKVETLNNQVKGWLEPGQQCASAYTTCS
jgi:uncharacterized protein YgiM (DUF1202 family)